MDMEDIDGEEGFDGARRRRMMNYVELLQEFHTLGCSDKIKCATACLVYNTLKQKPNLFNLDKLYIADLNEILLHCRRDNGKSKAKSCYYYSVPASQSLDMLKLEKIQNYVRKLEPKRWFFLAICDTSSNVIVYRIRSGFYDKRGVKSTTESIPMQTANRIDSPSSMAVNSVVACSNAGNATTFEAGSLREEQAATSSEALA